MLSFCTFEISASTHISYNQCIVLKETKTPDLQNHEKSFPNQILYCKSCPIRTSPKIELSSSAKNLDLSIHIHIYMPSAVRGLILHPQVSCLSHDSANSAPSSLLFITSPSHYPLWPIGHRCWRRGDRQWHCSGGIQYSGCCYLNGRPSHHYRYHDSF